MAYVIAEPCIGTKDTACVDACPVDCIHPKKDNPAYAEEEMLYIDPVECIDCGACVPVCPVSAIFALDDLPEKWKSFTERNAKYFGRLRVFCSGLGARQLLVACAFPFAM
jgi:NAD-dependent dihydropyrimidine dehydrogenase PreA subunit